MSNKLGYKTSEIGIIPNEWEVVRLGDVLTFTKNGLTYRQTKQGKYPVTRIETISEGVIDTNKLGYLDNLSDEEIKGYNLEVGDILFSHINSIKHIAKAAIYLGKPELLIHGMNLLLLRPNKEKVDPMFLLFYLKYEETRNRFRSWAKKAVNQASINQSELNAFLIPLLPFAEQQKIASILSNVDEALQKTDEIIQKVQVLKKGLMQQLLTKGIRHIRFKETEIGEIPEEWKVVKFRDVSVRIQNGLYKEKEFYGDGYQIVRMTELFKGDILETNAMQRVNVNNVELAKYSLIDGDLLFARRSLKVEGSGKCVMVPDLNEPILFESSMIRVTLDKNVADPKFYLYYFNSQIGRRLITRIIRTVAVSGVTGRDLQKLSIPLPKIPEQQKISETLSATDNRIEKEEQKKEQLEKLKKGLMQDLLTGRVRVKVS